MFGVGVTGHTQQLPGNQMVLLDQRSRGEFRICDELTERRNPSLLNKAHVRDKNFRIEDCVVQLNPKQQNKIRIAELLNKPPQ